MSTETGKTIFFKFNDETKKARGEVSSIDDLKNLFLNKFGSSGDQLPGAESLSFYVEDQKYNVQHKLDDLEEVYDGVILDVRDTSARADVKTEMLSNELQELKRKLQTLETDAPKRRRTQTKEGEEPAMDINEGGSHFVRLRGLPWEANDKTVREFFDECNISDNGVFFLMNQSGRKTGEAFVTFEDADSVAKAVKKNKEYMGRRYVEVYEATLAEKQKAIFRTKKATESNAFVDPSVFIVRMRGLPYSATEEQIREFYEDVAIGNVHLTFDHMGRPSGEAFVELPDEATQKQALLKDRSNLGNRYVELFRCSHTQLQASLCGQRGNGRNFNNGGGFPGGRGGGNFRQQYDRDVRHDYGGPRRGPGGGVGLYGQQRGGPPGPYGQPPVEESEWNQPESSPYPAADPYGQYGTQPQPPYQGGVDFCLKMRGLPYSSTDVDVTRFFQEVGCVPMRIHKQSGGGEAFCEFSTGPDLDRALSRHKANIGNRYIELFRVSYREMADVIGI